MIKKLKSEKKSPVMNKKSVKWRNGNWKKVRNLVVKSIPAQKLPKHKNSAHLCEITLLEGNSPLLFQVIIFILS